MAPPDPEQEVEALRERLETWNYQYYVLDDPTVPDAEYDRAMARLRELESARRVLIASGLQPDRIAEVRGYAARHLKNPENPLDPRNRRISVLLPFEEEPEVQEFEPTGSSVVGEAPLPADFLPVPEADR